VHIFFKLVSSKLAAEFRYLNTDSTDLIGSLHNTLLPVVLGKVGILETDIASRVDAPVRMIDAADALMYTICCGCSPKAILHQQVTVGSTLERLRSWRSLWEVRPQAREERVGTENIQKWSKFLEELGETEKAVIKELHEYTPRND
jgi:hypothetical protein